MEEGLETESKFTTKYVTFSVPRTQCNGKQIHPNDLPSSTKSQKGKLEDKNKDPISSLDETTERQNIIIQAAIAK